jgi:hypothetical protein
MKLPKNRFLALLLAPSLLSASTPPAAPTAPTTAPVATAPRSTAPVASASKSPWAVSIGVSARETYDTNVFMQDRGGASSTATPNHESFVTSLGGTVSLAYKPGPDFNAILGYSVENHTFHDASGENNTHHRLSADLKGKSGGTPWDTTNSILLIDGANEGLIFASPGGVPAAGGIAVRDRRDAIVYRHAAKATFAFGDWFLRPLTSIYIHDFRSDQIDDTASRINYVDRAEYQAGADLGTKLGAYTAYLGYRYGYQDQSLRFGTGTDFSNNFHRVLLGIEGTVTSKLKIKLQGGPDFREIVGNIPSTVASSSTEFFCDSSIIYTPTKADTFTLSARRFMQPGYTGRSLYTDSTYDLTWNHKITSAWSVGAGYRAYNTDFQPVATRNDWIYTTSINTSYALNAKTSLQASYSRDISSCDVAGASSVVAAGREYTRDLVSIGLKYQFR